MVAVGFNPRNRIRKPYRVASRRLKSIHHAHRIHPALLDECHDGTPYPPVEIHGYRHRLLRDQNGGTLISAFEIRGNSVEPYQRPVLRTQDFAVKRTSRFRK